MDRLIHTVGNALTNIRDRQLITAQNLSNLSVPGYRRDLQGQGQSLFLQAPGTTTTRAFQIPGEAYAFAQQSGFLDQTAEPLDIAIPDRGYFYVKPEQGEPALSRRGDLRVDLQGNLLNGAGEAVLDTAQQPIVLPPYRDIVIDDLGQISITAPDAADGQRTVVATLATVVPAEGEALRKGLDGQIRRPDGTLPPPDQQARVLQGVLEHSNVNPTEELISSIDEQRRFELNMRLVSEAKSLDEAGSRLLRLPEG